MQHNPVKQNVLPLLVVAESRSSGTRNCLSSFRDTYCEKVVDTKNRNTGQLRSGGVREGDGCCGMSMWW